MDRLTLTSCTIRPSRLIRQGPPAEPSGYCVENKQRHDGNQAGVGNPYRTVEHGFNRSRVARLDDDEREVHAGKDEKSSRVMPNLPIPVRILRATETG